MLTDFSKIILKDINNFQIDREVLGVVLIYCNEETDAESRCFEVFNFLALIGPLEFILNRFEIAVVSEREFTK